MLKRQMNNSSFVTKLNNTSRIIYINSDTFDENRSSKITSLENSTPIIYVKNPTVTPVYSQSDSSTVIGSTITQGNTSTTIYNSDASIFDMINSTTLMYIAGGVLILYLVIS